MPKLAGRRVFYAALAVPIAMVIAPLNASACDPDVTVVAEQAQPGAVATENETVAVATEADGFADGPDWYLADDADVVSHESEDTQVTYVVNGIHDDTAIGNVSEETTVVEDDGFSPGPVWYVTHDVDDAFYADDAVDTVDAEVVHSEVEDTQVTYVINGIYHDSVVGNASGETTVVEDDGFSPGPNWYVADDADVVSHESEDTQVTYVINGIHDDTAIGNVSEENAYVSDGVDGFVVHEHDDIVVHEDDDVDVNVDADLDTEGYSDGHGDGECVCDDDDGTSTSYEELSAGAGDGGAYVVSTESSSFDLD